MTDTVPIPTLEGFAAGRPPLVASRRRAVPVARGTAVGIVALVVLLLGVLAAWAAGVRVFVVESPSMGSAAPVGSLVVGSASRSAEVGDLITFDPPGTSALPYTHRIVARTPDGFRTRGDINGAADPWTVTPAMMIARETAVVPGAGWVVKAAPVLLAALVLAQIVGLFVRSPSVRWSVRTAAVALSVAWISWTMRPFSGYVLLQSSPAPGGMRAQVVSTALLPLRITALGGGHVDLHSGQVGHLLLPRGAGGHVTMTSQLALDPLGWVLVALVCLLPVVVVLAFGVPVREEPADAAA